jgi:Ribbon-helix-helix protein, copG family
MRDATSDLMATTVALLSPLIATETQCDDVPRKTDIISTMVRTIVQLPDEQAAALERAARRRGISKAAVVREALGRLLGPEEASDDEAVRRALSAAGCFASGVHDLAERHDDYLAQS